jgi:hypothetical protein
MAIAGWTVTDMLVRYPCARASESPRLDLGSL